MCGVGLARRKNLRVYVQNVPVCTGTMRTCVTTCAHGAGTHGDVLNLHTEVFGTDTHGGEVGEEGEERGVTDNSAYHETAHVEFSLAPMGHRKQPNVLAHLKFQSR